MYLALLFAGGLGAACAALSLGALAWRAAPALAAAASGRARAAFRRRSRVPRDLLEHLRAAKRKSEASELAALGAAAGGAGLLLALALPGLLLKVYGFFLGAAAGALGYLRYDALMRGGEKLRRLQEAVLLYDAVDVFTGCGMGLGHALEKSLPLLRRLRPAVERCVAQYPFGPTRAVAEMERDLGFEEAGTLVSVFLHLASSGRGGEVAASEAVKLEKMRRALARTSSNLKPVWQQFQLLFPVFCGMALVLYCLARHVQLQFASLSGQNVVQQLVR